MKRIVLKFYLEILKVNFLKNSRIETGAGRDFMRSEYERETIKRPTLHRASGAPCIAIKMLLTKHRECAENTHTQRSKVQSTENKVCANKLGELAMRLM